MYVYCYACRHVVMHIMCIIVVVRGGVHTRYYARIRVSAKVDFRADGNAVRGGEMNCRRRGPCASERDRTDAGVIGTKGIYTYAHGSLPVHNGPRRPTYRNVL